MDFGRPKSQRRSAIIKPGNGLHQRSVCGHGAAGRGHGRSLLGAGVWGGRGVGTENRSRGREAVSRELRGQEGNPSEPERHSPPREAGTRGSRPLRTPLTRESPPVFMAHLQMLEWLAVSWKGLKRLRTTLTKPAWLSHSPLQYTKTRGPRKHLPLSPTRPDLSALGYSCLSLTPAWQSSTWHYGCTLLGPS